MGRVIWTFSPRQKAFDHDSSARSLLGKRVVAENGEIIGRVEDLLFSGTTIDAIRVNRGITSIVIDMAYVADTEQKSVVLRINPANRYVGMHVFDSVGRRLGKVIGIDQRGQSNTLESITVKRGLLGRTLTIPASDISVSEKNIILSKEYDERHHHYG